METLFLAHRIPYPPNRGDKIRSWNMLKFLSNRGRVHLACFADDAGDAAHIEGLRAELGSRLGEMHVEVRTARRVGAAVQALSTGAPVSLPMFASAPMQRFVDSVLETSPIETVFAFSGQMAQFVPDPCPVRFVMDFVDMDSAKFAAYAAGHRGAMSWIHAREAERLFAFERATAARADLSLFVSEAEAGLFRTRAALPGADIRAVHNGIDLGFYDPTAAFPPIAGPAAPMIVFTGQMDYRPNVEAVTAFADETLPAIRAARPDAVFAIVGRQPLEEVRRLAGRPGILVSGAVADVRSWIAAAACVVAPLRTARGIQNKVLEAMAMAKPVVASPAAFEGIEAEPGRDLLVADGGQAEAEAVLGLFADPQRAAAIGRAARARMESAYRWEARLAPLAQWLDGPRRAAA